jgi:hypothetical protein
VDVLACPFCGAPETDRFDLEGHRFLVFGCLFSPEVDATLSEEALARHLTEVYRDGAGPGYFRRMCDQLHVYVTKGPGARRLGAPAHEPGAEP